jgi:hypothetical protein
MRLILLIISGLLGLAAVTLSCISGDSKRATPRLGAVHRNVIERESLPAAEGEASASPTLRR